MALQCRPVDKYWDTAVTGKCFSMATVEKIVIVQGVCSIITDVIGAAFPVVLLWNVKISIRTKVALCLLMGLGVITAVACVVRTSFSWQIKSNDVTWVGIPNALARMIEINLGIIAACAPVMRPLVRYIDARIAGKDTDQLFRKTSSPRIHSHWYTNLWTSRFASLPGSYATDAKSDPSSRRNLFHVAARKAHFNDTTMTTTETLDLPIQGIRKTTEFDVGEHEADAFESQRSLDAGMGTRWLVQHQV
ncbi:hypothetical protein MMC12_002718 [Toensbergia leucococca]|nr:hypothetical protein [Toensbergia leucococca]